MKPKNIVALSGMLIYMGVSSLYQDFLGKDGYIQKVNESWVSGSITIPLAICLIALGIYLFQKYSKVYHFQKTSYTINGNEYKTCSCCDHHDGDTTCIKYKHLILSPDYQGCVHWEVKE